MYCFAAIWLNSALSFIAVLVGILSTVWLIHYRAPYLSSIMLSQEGHIVGYVVIEGDSERIEGKVSEKSLENWFGFWLVIAIEQGENIQLKRFFLFRDSLSGQNCSRLSRVIRRR